MTYLERLDLAEDLLANNLTWLRDKFDLPIRQGDAECIKKLAEIDQAWRILCIIRFDMSKELQQQKDMAR